MSFIRCCLLAALAQQNEEKYRNMDCIGFVILNAFSVFVDPFLMLFPVFSYLVHSTSRAHVRSMVLSTFGFRIAMIR